MDSGNGMSRQEDSAGELETAVLELLTEASTWSDADWYQVIPSTGWTRAATVIALRYQQRRRQCMDGLPNFGAGNFGQHRVPRQAQ